MSRRLASLSSLITLLVAWESVCRKGWVSPVLLSPPSAIASSLVELLRSGAIAGDLASTIAAFALSLLLAVGFGVAVGITMGMSESMYFLLHPYIVSLNSVPKIALMPVIVLWFGLGLPPKVFLGSLMGGFPVAMAAYGGMRSLERDTLLVARAFGAGRWRILRSVVLPGLAPHVLASMRVAVNYVFVGVLTAEFFASDGGLGYKMVLYSSNFQTERFFSLLCLVAAIALACAGLVRLAERRFFSWAPEFDA